MKDGSLTVVGTGIRGIGQLTQENLGQIRHAEKLFHLVADHVTESWLAAQNPSAESLYSSYAEGRDRLETYAEIVGRVLGPVREGRRVCVAVYGHPAILNNAVHEAIRLARAEGHDARMLPGISAEDCLIADLGIDPGRDGLQSYEATDFLVRRRVIDPCAGLILWQVGLLGQADFRYECRTEGLPLLVEHLGSFYGPSHRVVVYEAGVHPILEPVIRQIGLEDLPGCRATLATTLYVPPIRPAAVDRDMLGRLNAALGG